MTEQRPGAGQVLAAAGKALAFLALFLGCQLAVSYVYLYHVLGELGPNALTDPELYDILYGRLMAAATGLTLVSGLLTLAVLAVFYFAIQRERPGTAMWLRLPDDRALLWSGAALAPALYLAVTLVMSMLPARLLEDYNDASAGLEEASAAAFLCVAVVSPIVEEVVFRGLIMTRLARVVRPMTAVLLSAAVFGLCHGELVWFCYAFVLGVVFGWMDMRARSILPSMLAHITFNTIGQTISTLNALFPKGGWEIWVMAGLLVIAAVAAMLDRSGIGEIFRPLPEEMEDAGDGSPVPAALRRPPDEERFDGAGSYTCRDDVTEQDPWKD